VAETLTIDFRRAMPLFPLPDCVLLPHATIPLHIFEKRYRKLTSDALDTRGLIAMALFEGDGWRDDYEGSPALRPNVCLGYIVDHQKLEDGRYVLLLQGVCRAKIREEVPGNAYRLALLQPTEFPQPKEQELAEQRSEIETLLNDPILSGVDSVRSAKSWLKSEVPTSALVDLTLQVLCAGTEERYRMLAESDPRLRARWLTDHLRETRSSLGTPRRRPKST
jgi:Lon protease-like protein